MIYVTYRFSKKFCMHLCAYPFNINSISLSSADENCLLARQARLLSSCSVELTPINTVVTRLSFSNQLKAICASDWITAVRYLIQPFYSFDLLGRNFICF